MPQQFIKEHSGVIALILSILFGMIVTFIGWFIKHVRSKIMLHIEKSEKELVPHINNKIDALEDKLMGLHIENIKRFSNLDKRLSIMENKTKDNLRDVLSVLDKLAVKMDKANKDG